MSDVLTDKPSLALHPTQEQDDYVHWDRTTPVLDQQRTSSLAGIAGRLYNRLQQERELTEKLSLELKHNRIRPGWVAVPRSMTVDMLAEVLEYLESEELLPKGMTTAEKLRLVDKCWSIAVQESTE